MGAGTAKNITEMAKKGKRYRAAQEMLAQIDGPVGVAEAAELVKKTASAKFDESVDLDVLSEWIPAMPTRWSAAR